MWTATRQHSTIPSITTNICRQMKPAIYRAFWIMPGASAAGPFLGFTRSLLRIGLHKKHFGGLHVMLLRDPYSMFASLLSQEFERSAILLFYASQLKIVLSGGWALSEMAPA